MPHMHSPTHMHTHAHTRTHTHTHAHPCAHTRKHTRLIRSYLYAVFSLQDAALHYFNSCRCCLEEKKIWKSFSLNQKCLENELFGLFLLPPDSNSFHLMAFHRLEKFCIWRWGNVFCEQHFMRCKLAFWNLRRRINWILFRKKMPKYHSSLTSCEVAEIKWRST